MSARPKGRTRRPNFTHTTIQVCGRLVSERYDLICLLPPHLTHTTHVAIATAEDEIYLISRQNDRVYIQGDEGQWLEVEDHKG